MRTPIFTSLSSNRIAAYIGRARNRVCYAAPGLQDQAAVERAALKSAAPTFAISVSLDFDEHTLRMGYGSLSAVETIRAVGIEPTYSRGFRTAVLIVDGEGWIRKGPSVVRRAVACLAGKTQRHPRRLTVRGHRYSL